MIHRFETIDSTNTQACQMAQEGAPHGTALVAKQQTGGRGRLGRSFHSPAGSGLYFSMILRPKTTPAQLMHLTCAAAVAVCRAIEETAGISPAIKWTNDLVWGKKKLGGILTELGFEGQNLSYAVVGIGLNCTQKEADFPPELQHMATSLASAAGKEINISALEEALYRHLLEIADQLLTHKPRIMAAYKASCMTIGQQVRVVGGDTDRQGKALDVDADGGLVVQFADGQIQTVASGEVSIRGMYGYI